MAKIFTKIHKVLGRDDLRPAMQFAWFEDGFVNATNAHIFYHGRLAPLFDFMDAEVDMLEGRAIHAGALGALYNKTVMVKPTDNGPVLRAQFEYYHVDYPTISIEDMPGEKGFVRNWREALPWANDHGKPEAVDAIGINPELLKTASDCLVCEHENAPARLDFYGATKAIRMTATDIEDKHQWVAVMPALLIV